MKVYTEKQVLGMMKAVALHAQTVASNSVSNYVAYHPSFNGPAFLYSKSREEIAKQAVKEVQEDFDAIIEEGKKS